MVNGSGIPAAAALEEEEASLVAFVLVTIQIWASSQRAENIPAIAPFDRILPIEVWLQSLSTFKHEDRQFALWGINDLDGRNHALIDEYLAFCELLFPAASARSDPEFTIFRESCGVEPRDRNPLLQPAPLWEPQVQQPHAPASTRVGLLASAASKPGRYRTYVGGDDVGAMHALHGIMLQRCADMLGIEPDALQMEVRKIDKAMRVEGA
ncbi:hypothetical protein BDK51DRAFT_39567 [Blyttiomyces helicus]|uniref:Uncharacterized protein n=1 Tax=Blyttiomyces helicus TaxID=388810 RepID=A0A4P9WLE7_9FUNG|nr:hypothetical protein BDK51DRAFT_39567 [Blyttiomyces helicus]|eukprot:RKO91950.1 hypothetical protein BDK51DRAFT_39567 [Blyttiomyces helicus]